MHDMYRQYDNSSKVLFKHFWDSINKSNMGSEFNCGQSPKLSEKELFWDTYFYPKLTEVFQKQCIFISMRCLNTNLHFEKHEIMGANIRKTTLGNICMHRLFCNRNIPDKDILNFFLPCTWLNIMTRKKYVKKLNLHFLQVCLKHELTESFNAAPIELVFLNLMFTAT